MDDALLHGGLMDDTIVLDGEIISARRPPRTEVLEAGPAWSWICVSDTIRIWVIHPWQKNQEVAESVIRAAQKMHERYHRHMTKKSKHVANRDFLDL